MAKLDDAALANFLQPFKDKGGDILLALGITPVEIEEGRAVLKMPLTPSTSQLTGVFAAGALISLADITATVACTGGNNNIDGTFPFAVQLSANILRNTNTGTATAEARVVHSGRTMKVAETTVSDDNNRVLVRVTTTHLIAPAVKK